MSNWLSGIPLRPLATGTALYILTRGPHELRIALLERLQTLLTTDQILTLIKGLKWLLAIDGIRYVNKALNNLALSNFQLSGKSRWNWSQEIAVVTGGASGFGKLFSLDLAKHGIRIVALDISDAPADLEGHPLITFMKCDVTDPAAVKDIAKRIQHSVGHPTILINNAGIALSTPVLDTPPDKLQKIMGVNLMAHYYMVQEFLPKMLEQKKGHIVTIASVASFIATPMMSSYCATKAGVQAFHESLQSELRAIHDCPEINMTIVHPAWAATAMVAPHQERLEKGGQRVMNPQIISDAVVKQILSARGGRLVIGKGTSIIQRFRFYPKWLTWMLLRRFESTAQHDLKMQ